MAKITWTDKQSLYPSWNENFQFSADNANEIKSSVNDLYDIVGAGAVTDNLIVVSINTGGATNKIKSTVEAITDSAVDNTYLVSVRPGIYIEDDFTIPEYVAVISAGTDRVTEIQANSTSGTLITLNPHVSFHGFRISGKTSGIGILINQSGPYKVHDITFENCDTCINVNHSTAEVVLSIIDFEGTITNGLDAQAGKIDILNWDIGLNHTITTIIDASGTDTNLKITDFITESSNVTTVMNFYDGITVNASVISGIDFYDGIVISGDNNNITINNMVLRDAQNDGVRIESSGTGTVLSMFSTIILGSGNYNGNFNNSTCIVNGGGYSEIDKLFAVPGAALHAFVLDTQENDEAVNIVGELHVGRSGFPAESVFGEGDSHVKLLAYTTDDDISYTDITADVISASGSTFTYESANAGSTIYLANLGQDLTGAYRNFCGFKSNVTTAAVLGSGNFIIQYYNSISGWLDCNYMETQSEGRYYQHGDNIFTHTGSHHIRIDVNIPLEDDVNLKWDINDPVTYGTDLYWIRIKIENTITTAPVFEQFKIHTNRHEINSDGWNEYFGTARPKFNLPIALGAGRELAGSMGNANIWIDENLGEGLVDNQFSATTQYWGLSFSIPNGLDTSCGIDLFIACRANGAGSVTLQCIVGKITEGDSAYVSNPILGPIPSRAVYTDTQTFSAADEVKFFNFHIIVKDFLSRKNPADGTEYPDIAFFTINPTVLPVYTHMIHMENSYYRWATGGHI